MGTFSVGTVKTAGCSYDCTITYDSPTRSGDKVKIKNVKATISCTSENQTLNRIGFKLWINGTNKADNTTILSAYDTSWPSSKEVTVINNDGYEFNCLDKTFSIKAEFRATGYGSDWSGNYGSTGEQSGSISCPARTYSVTYDANGGSGAPSAQSKEYNVTLKLSTTEPTKSGHDFKGWSGSDGNTYQKGDNYTGNAALTLTAVWQAQTTDLDDVADTEIGDYPSVSFTPPSADLDYYITFSMGTWSHTTDMISPSSTDKYTFNSYALPYEVCNQIPNSETGLMQVDLDTYSSGTKTGTSTKYFTVMVPEEVVPEFDTIVLERATENALEVYLENYSEVSATITINKAYLSDIAEVTMTIGDDTYVDHPLSVAATYTISYITSDVLKGHGSTTITFTATDTRGHSATTTETITIYEYNLPTAHVSLERLSNKVVQAELNMSYSEISGNSATYVYNNHQAQPVINQMVVFEQAMGDYWDSRNYNAELTVTDAITSVTYRTSLYPGKGNRFNTLSVDQFYVGIDDTGWKDIASTYDGGIDENGVIWFERTSGNGPIGIGFPVRLDPDSDYELIYSADRVTDDTVAFVSFFSQFGSGETSFSYLSTTYDGGHLESGEIIHTPQVTEHRQLWGILILGVDPNDYELTPTGRQEFSNIVLRKIVRSEEALEWDLETGNLGLDTPNQKYISRIQQRVDYNGSLKVEIAYDNASEYTKVHESTSDHMRSITVPIKVKRSDHFRIRLSGTGEVRLYSFGYQTDEGGDRCLI